MWRLEASSSHTHSCIQKRLNRLIFNSVFAYLRRILPSNCDLRLVAVSSRHHPLAGDEGSAAEVVSGVQGHLVGNGVTGALIPSYDLIIRCGNWNSTRGITRHVAKREYFTFPFIKKCIRLWNKFIKVIRYDLDHVLHAAPSKARNTRAFMVTCVWILKEVHPVTPYILYVGLHVCTFPKEGETQQ